VKTRIPVIKVKVALPIGLLAAAFVSDCDGTALPVSKEAPVVPTVAPLHETVAATPTIASDAARSIAEIHMIDANNGWAWSSGVEGQYLLLRTTDGGQLWRDVTPRAFPYLEYGGWFLDSQTAWVATLDRKTYAGGLLRTADGGKSWSVLVMEGAAPFKCLTAGSRCEFFNANHAVARTAEFGLGNAYYRYLKRTMAGRRGHQSSSRLPILTMTCHPARSICAICVATGSVIIRQRRSSLLMVTRAMSSQRAPSVSRSR